MMSTPINFFKLVSRASMIMAFFLMSYFFYLQFYPIEVVTLNKSPIRVESKEVKRGEVQKIYLNFTKNKQIKPTVTFSLVDGISIPLESSSVTRPVGENVFEISKQIPDHPIVVNSEYVIQIDISYQISPFRTIEYSWQTEPFMVVD